MNTWLRLTLVLFMVGGGFAGLTVTLVALLNHSAVQGSFTFLIAGILTFALATCGGLLFVLDYRHTRLMQITLAAQMVQISSPIGVYKFLTGVGFYLLFSSGQIEPQWAVSRSIWIGGSILAQDGPSRVPKAALGIST